MSETKKRNYRSCRTRAPLRRVLYREMPLLRELIGGALIVFSVYQINRKS